MKKILVLVLLCTTFLISGCNNKKVEICTTSYPIEYLFQRIGEPYIETCNISSDVTIQVASLKKSYKEDLENSNALFYISGMEPYFEIYSKDIREVGTNYVDLMNYGYYYDFQRVIISTNNGTETQEMTSYYDGDVFNNINTYTKDPFVWMDPLTMLSTAEVVRDYLISEYPEHEAKFIENYEELEIDLTNLDAQYQVLKDSNMDIAFVSMTPSFGNWQNAFGIRVYPVILSKYGALPNERQLEIIKQKIRDDGVLYIAHEQNLTPKIEELYNELVAELGLIPIELSNLSSLSEKEANNNQDYLTIMYENFKVLESIGN
ncbi:zinc transport system substrate-binding protein [Breznakia sp. PF5-3]|uniref:metal ABC transporter substrate-binding protein n=1 Tax=unclassified Breznakia TaxID=2623764 RepID=UPI002406F41C|nr:MULTISPECIES: zinc ABC transporter substrate-binding protein [unclassified Breznakia]MDF9824126.1 zinc transport system substrate-binding protein [Breznakia sp. PM6-1]MDF9834924.1 zinc transport system substrate-binding protein [Breznakia sp. PF5-3]MDF9837207.1 zinc transport system substrate-binding protein [Breznakia sp. PFB2-8]MDF9859197.1 zinc transport system substrate-binding protein [Breznakia sp. PH5-24]